MKKRYKLIPMAVALLLGLWCTSCGTESAQLKTLILPDLSANEPVVVEQIEARFELVSQKPKGEEGAKAWGELGMLFNTYFFKEAAEICYANASILSPDDDDWPYLQGSLFLYWGRLEEAIEQLNRAHSMDQNNSAAAISLARAYIQANQPDRAGPLFQAVLNRDDTSAAAWFGLGIIAAKAGDHNTAIEFFHKVLANQPQASSVSHALGMSLRALGRIDEARTVLEQGGDVPVTFTDPLREKIAAMGKSSTFLMMLAEQSLSQSRPDLAAGYYQDALKSHGTLVAARLALAGLLVGRGDADAALELLAEGLRIENLSESDRVILLRRAAPLLERAHQADDAIASLGVALGLQPDPQTAIELARTRVRAGKLKEALVNYNEVIADQGDKVPLLVERARLLLTMKKAKEAVTDLKGAVALDAKNCFIRMELARALAASGDKDEAARQWSEADALSLARPADRVPFIKQKALEIARGGDLTGATQLLRESLADLEPANELRWLLGKLLGQMNRFEEAMVELDRVVAEEPTWTAVRMNRVSACLMADKYQAARARLTQDLRHNPADQVLAHALARLLATAPPNDTRDGVLALDLAQKVWDRDPSAIAAETLAMALAAAGKFEEAEAQALRLSEEARDAGDIAGARRLGGLRQVFAAKKVWLAQSGREILEAAAGIRP